MPTSRSSASPVEYWVDGSRRDVSMEEFYTMGPELGRGATSVVFRTEEKQTQKPYAAKVLKKTIDKKIVRTEIGVLLRLSHPNIVKTLVRTTSPQMSSPKMVGGEFLQLCKPTVSSAVRVAGLTISEAMKPDVGDPVLAWLHVVCGYEHDWTYCQMI